eukprot:TRINITY_DN2529_c0_g2_i10.p2 TRINITY_DN2529_c0_g2~~TRINITY_DN2529_c0_g2_i10.p2  ORF type:complete len:162 (+),score=21.19 TRINITY_DN2529_c0_g2_i10:197-682(+)
MPYSAEDLLRDCASSKRSRLKGDLGKYQDIWIALSAWIRSRVERKLGAVIPGFGQWVWYSQAVAPGDAHALDPETAPGLRAGFSLSDRFMKTYNLVSKVRDCAAFRQTKLKEVNVYEVAIRCATAQDASPTVQVQPAVKEGRGLLRPQGFAPANRRGRPQL